MSQTDVKRKVLDRIGRAMGRFQMLRSGDRVGVGVSGGKDSLCLVHALTAYRRRAPFDFEIVAITIEQGSSQNPLKSSGSLWARWVSTGL